MFVVDALWEAAMSCVATAQACREAISSLRMARFFKADDAVAFVMLRRSSAATFKAPCAAGSLGFFAAPYRHRMADTIESESTDTGQPETLEGSTHAHMQAPLGGSMVCTHLGSLNHLGSGISKSFGCVKQSTPSFWVPLTVGFKFDGIYQRLCSLQ